MEEKVMKHNDWTVQNEIYPLFKFVLPMFESIFGQAVMNKEPYCVYVDTDCRTAPTTLPNYKCIVLESNPTCQCRVIYQLAHELTHYSILQRTNNQYGNTCAAAAFEEPACVAMSLYILKLCSEQWDKNEDRKCNCILFPERKLHKNFENYRTRRYEDVSVTDPCATYEQWEDICNGFTGILTSDLDRPNVSAMRNELYDAFVQFPDDIGLISEYPLYMRSAPYEKLIDECAWKAAKPSKTAFITAICAVQPVVI